MTTPARIRWEPADGGGSIGYVGTMDGWAFRIWDAQAPDGPWRLDSTLAGEFMRNVNSPDPEALKAEAERWLAGFVASLGASFAAEPAKEASR